MCCLTGEGCAVDGDVLSGHAVRGVLSSAGDGVLSRVWVLSRGLLSIIGRDIITRLPPVDRQTGVKTLPCLRLHLKTVKHIY